MTIMRTFTAIFVILSLFQDGITHPDGAPPSACATMKPRHHHVNPSACSPDYIIVPETYDYAVGDAVRVTVRSITPDKTFRGVLVLAKDANNTIVGRWTTKDPLLHKVSCGGVTHSSKVDKTSVQATWYASSELIGNISIKATIVRNYTTVYVDCYNVTLTARETNNTTSTINPLTNITLHTKNAPLTSSSPGNTTMTSSPTSNVGVNVSWTFDAGNITTVRMDITNLKPAQWAAIGLSIDERMGKTHVFVCRRLANDTVDINRFVNPGGHSHPVLAGSGQGGTFTIERQGFDQGVVFCQFTLSNFENQVRGHLIDIPKLSQSNPYHPLFAIGQLDDSNKLRKHSKDSRTAQSRLVQLNRAENIVYNIKPLQPDDQSNLLKAHGIIMVFTWMVIASTGVLISRHFKNSWSTTMLCGKAVWFAVHRVLMSVASILTLIAFLFIFTCNEGAWVKGGLTKEFVHSITGVIVLGLAFFQPFIVLFRCESDSPHRFIFNYLHACVGFLAFVLSTATIFLATFFTSIFPNRTGWLIMVAWSFWVVAIFIAFERIKLYFGRQNSSSSSSSTLHINIVENDIVGELAASATPLLTENIGKNDEKSFNPLEQRLKNILLVLHVLVAIGLSLTLAILIWHSE